MHQSTSLLTQIFHLSIFQWWYVPHEMRESSRSHNLKYNAQNNWNVAKIDAMANSMIEIAYSFKIRYFGAMKRQFEKCYNSPIKKKTLGSK